MGHDHGHGERGDTLNRNLLISIVLNGIIVVAEIIGGLLSGSLSLLSNAMHNMSDVAALMIAWIARRIGQRGPTPSYTYGMKRAEVIAAMINAVVLLIVVSLIIREAVGRFFSPETIQGSLMLIVAVIGLFANLFSVFLLKSHVHGDLNMRSAFLHLAQDTASSVVVVVVALFATGRYGPYLDAAASILVALAVLFSGWRVLKETFLILMEATPAGIDVEELKRDMEQTFEGIDFHHIHVWTVGSGQKVLSAHVLLPDLSLSECENVLGRIRRRLSEKWGINHVTLEPEVTGCGSNDTLGSGL